MLHCALTLPDWACVFLWLSRPFLYPIKCCCDPLKLYKRSHYVQLLWLVKVYLGGCQQHGWWNFGPSSWPDRNCLCRRCCLSPQMILLPCPLPGPQLEWVQDYRKCLETVEVCLFMLLCCRRILHPLNDPARLNTVTLELIPSERCVKILTFYSAYMWTEPKLWSVHDKFHWGLAAIKMGLETYGTINSVVMYF